MVDLLQRLIDAIGPIEQRYGDAATIVAQYPLGRGPAGSVYEHVLGRGSDFHPLGRDGDYWEQEVFPHTDERLGCCYVVNPPLGEKQVEKLLDVWRLFFEMTHWPGYEPPTKGANSTLSFDFLVDLVVEAHERRYLPAPPREEIFAALAELRKELEPADGWGAKERARLARIKDSNRGPHDR